MASLAKILVLIRINYKVYATIGPTVSLIIDTGAGPNLIRKEELPPRVEERIAHGPSWDIWDANNRSLRTIGLLKMPVRLGHFINLVELIVFDKLAVRLC